MSFDIAFYDAVDMKKAAAHGERHQAGAASEHGSAAAGEDVFTLLGDWQEDTLDIQAFLQARNVDAPPPTSSPVNRTPVIVRPNNLDLTQSSSSSAGHYGGGAAAAAAPPRGCGQVSPHHHSVHQVPDAMHQVSPQHSPYGQSATMFDYGGVAKQQQQQQSKLQAMHQQQQQQQHRSGAQQQQTQQQQHAAMMAAAASSPCTPVFGSYAAASSSGGILGGGCLRPVIKRDGGDDDDDDDDESSIDSYHQAALRGGGASRKRSAAAASSSSSSELRDPDAYRAKRERNNVAVRKSREKKKQREQETEKRVKELSDENAALQGKVELLSKQLATIKSLFAVLTKSLPAEHRRRAEQELDSLGVAAAAGRPSSSSSYGAEPMAAVALQQQQQQQQRGGN